MSTIDHRDHLDASGHLAINPRAPFRLEVIIDNQDTDEYPDNPFTLNAYLGGPRAIEQEALVFAGEGALIDGDVPAQLRALADLIENGEVSA